MLKGVSVSVGLVVVGIVRRVLVILVWLFFSVNFLFSDDVMQFLSVGISMCRRDGSLFCFNDLIAFMYFSSGVSSFDNLMRCPSGLGMAFFLLFCPTWCHLVLVLFQWRGGGKGFRCLVNSCQ